MRATPRETGTSLVRKPDPERWPAAGRGDGRHCGCLSPGGVTCGGHFRIRQNFGGARWPPLANDATEMFNVRREAAGTWLLDSST